MAKKWNQVWLFHPFTPRVTPLDRPPLQATAPAFALGSRPDWASPLVRNESRVSHPPRKVGVEGHAISGREGARRAPSPHPARTRQPDQAESAEVA